MWLKNFNPMHFFMQHLLTLPKWYFIKLVSYFNNVIIMLHSEFDVANPFMHFPSKSLCSLMLQHVKIEETPAIFVYKDNSHHFYQGKKIVLCFFDQY